MSCSRCIVVMIKVIGLVKTTWNNWRLNGNKRNDKYSMTNKQNRQSKVGLNVHNGGSISSGELNKKMVSNSFCWNYTI